MKNNDAKSAGIIVVTTDKGLCGGMNTNVLRVVTNKLRDLQAKVSRLRRLRLATRASAFSTGLVQR
jgi:F-type H+-transporting ATPase subunit gamma